MTKEKSKESLVLEKNSEAILESCKQMSQLISTIGETLKNQGKLLEEVSQFLKEDAKTILSRVTHI